MKTLKMFALPLLVASVALCSFANAADTLGGVTVYAPVQTTNATASSSFAIADAIKVDLEGKLATISLYNTLVMNEYSQSGFFLTVSWYSHGDRVVFWPFGKSSDIANTKVIGLELSKPIPGGAYVPSVRFKYVDAYGITQFTPFVLLRDVITPAYR